MFSGTVRYNLNPFGGKAADADMWAALQQAGLRETVSALTVRFLGPHLGPCSAFCLWCDGCEVVVAFAAACYGASSPRTSRACQLVR